MKTKKKVTATLMICFCLTFMVLCTGMFDKKKDSKDVTVDVTANAKTEEVAQANTNESDLANQIETFSITQDQTIDKNQEEGLTNNQENQQESLSLKDERLSSNQEITFNTNQEETLAKKNQEAALKVVHSAVSDSVEDMIVSTLSLSEPDFAFNKVLPKVNDSLNIRAEADPNAEVVGKLYKNSYANILSRGEEWTKVKSGSVEGFVNNQYLYFDDEAVTIAKSLNAFRAQITAGSVNVRTKPTTDAEILSEAKSGDTFTHVPEMDTNGWVAILYDEEGTLAYVSKDFIETKFTLKTAVSKAEEEAAQKAAELEKALQEAKKYKPSTTNRAAISVSDEELYLLATVVAMEAGGESYEGQLAVANVVINRMLDGYWGDTISDVVYAPGQFSGANSGRVEKFSSRVTETNKRAAVEALAGNNNIGNYMYFIMKNKANYSSYKKYYILGCHCFYAR